MASTPVGLVTPRGLHLVQSSTAPTTLNLEQHYPQDHQTSKVFKCTIQLLMLASEARWRWHGWPMTKMGLQESNIRPSEVSESPQVELEAVPCVEW